MDQAIQLVGAIIILTAYAAGLTGRWRTDSLAYLILNLVGSTILAVVAALTSNWGFLLMEAVWSIATAWQLIKRQARSSPHADTP